MQRARWWREGALGCGVTDLGLRPQENSTSKPNQKQGGQCPLHLRCPRISGPIQLGRMDSRGRLSPHELYRSGGGSLRG